MSTSIWDKLQNIDRRILYWILFIGLMIPFIRPLGLAISVGPQTQDLYNELRRVKEGEVALINISSGVSAWAECLPALVASTKVLVQQKAKIIGVTSFVDGYITWEEIVKRVPGFSAYKYGTDYVMLGYYAGGETAVAQMATDIRSVYKTEYKGTPIENLPIMSKVNKATDVRVVLSSDTGDNADYYIRQWRTPYGIPLAEIGIAMNYAAYQPHYRAGILFGLVAGVRGGAEMEKLVGELGDATISMDAINVSHLMIVVAVILANVGYFATRGKK